MQKSTQYRLQLQITNSRTSGTTSEQRIKHHKEFPNQKLRKPAQSFPKHKSKPISKLLQLQPKRLQRRPTKILRMKKSNDRLMNTIEKRKTSIEEPKEKETEVHI
jgi:hypothetical protein